MAEEPLPRTVALGPSVDIVERLRNWQQSDCLGAQCVDERCEAADWIERLREYLSESERTFGSTTFAKDLQSKLALSLLREKSLSSKLGQLPKPCEWISPTDVDYDAWQTGCGQEFVFTSDGPIENSFKFCPYCGGAMTIAEKIEEDIDG